MDSAFGPAESTFVERHPTSFRPRDQPVSILESRPIRIEIHRRPQAHLPAAPRRFGPTRIVGRRARRAPLAMPAPENKSGVCVYGCVGVCVYGCGKARPYTHTHIL